MGLSHVPVKAKVGSVGVREVIKELRGQPSCCHLCSSECHLENDKPSKQHMINSESIPYPSNQLYVNLARLRPSMEAMVIFMATNKSRAFQHFM